MNIDSENTLMKDAAVRAIYSVSPFTLLDYPDKTACIIWFAGCNMRCPYCYNPEIVSGKGNISYFNALEFIISRRELLDGVVLSGGECTSHKNLEVFASAIKKLGMLVKVDTNGSNPGTIRKLIETKAVDYVALDFKAPVYKYHQVTGAALFNRFEQTFDLLNGSNLAFEVRTTFHSDLLTQEDFRNMALWLKEKKYKGIYYLQRFINDTSTLGNLRNSSKVDIGNPEDYGLPIVIRA